MSSSLVILWKVKIKHASSSRNFLFDMFKIMCLVELLLAYQIALSFALVTPARLPGNFTLPNSVSGLK